MTAWLWAAGAELTHDPSQPLRPVARTKRPAAVRDAQDVDFFGIGGHASAKNSNRHTGQAGLPLKSFAHVLNP